jgi:FkbM family methyltransferase
LHLANAVGPGGTVVAFEPTPDNYQNLVRNVDLNALGYVTPVCAAVSDNDGVAQFQFDRRRPTMGRLSSANAEMDNAEIMEVRQVALDSYEKRGWPAPSFLKIDVEGGAPGVFEGGHEVMKRCRPLVYIELHSLEERMAVRDLVARHDYRAFSVDGAPVEDPTAAHLTQLVCRPA